MIIQEHVIHKAQNSVSAKKILDEIVVAGGHQATELRYGFVVYSKSRNRIIEQVFVRKIGDNDFQVVKRTMKEGTNE